MADKIIVRKKCARCRMKAVDDTGSHCSLCAEELEAIGQESYHDHYFWALTASRDEMIFFVRIYHDCDSLDWRVGKSIKVDLENGGSVCGIADKAESMQKPPYERGDVITVTLKQNT